jgi:hypothetical protein
MADPRQVVRDFSIMGSTMRPLGNMNASAMIGRLRGGQLLTLQRQPDNPYDKNAIVILSGQYALGYLPRGLAAQIAPLMDSGVKVIARKAMNALYGVCQLAYIPPEVPQLPEGVTQEDLDTATPLPPLGDSRRLRPTKEVPDADKSISDPPEVA